jgi:DNA end-binding protein Ku
VSFGLVNVPIGLYPAEQRTDIQLHMLDSRDFARVRYERINEATGDEVPWNDIVKAYEYGDKGYVALTDEDFERASPKTSHSNEIQDFVPADAIDAIFYDTPYYLVPGKGAEKGYVLLREALRQTHTVGVARVVIRTRENLAVLKPEGRAIVLDLIRFAQELRPVEQYDIPAANAAEYGVQDREIEMAKRLVQAMATDWQPQRYQDEYRSRLLALIEEKVRVGASRRPPTVEEEEAVEAGKVVDMTEVLRRSVERSERERRKAG